MILGASFATSDPEQWLNRALFYGDGIFETMRFAGGQIPLFKWHQQRMNGGLERLHLDQPDWPAIITAIGQMPKELVSSAVIKLVVFRKTQHRGYQPATQMSEWLLLAEPFAPDQKTTYTLGVATGRLADQPMLAGMKHLNRLEQVMVADELNDQDVDDLLVLNQQGNVIETTRQNLVVVKDGQLLTPDLSLCGVRGVALEWLKSQYNVSETSFEINDMLRFDEVLLGNSLHGFRPVSQIKGLDSIGTARQVHGKISDLWNRLFKA